MKRKIERTVIAVLAFCMLLGSVPVLAEEYKSIDDMTLEELRIAYLELQLEYEKLKNEMSSDGRNGETAYDAEADAEEEYTDAYAVSVLMDENEFMDDIVASYNARSQIASWYTTDELNSMTADGRSDYFYECASAEEDFYYKYQNAFFEDETITSLCGQYVEGVGKQLEACQIYYETGDTQTELEYWNSGYYDRAYVIVMLSDSYGLPFGDISEMRAGLGEMDSTDASGTDSFEVDAATIQQVQQMLNGLGFTCDADGVFGENTAEAIEQFQEMYGYNADGEITDELLYELQSAYAMVTPSEEEYGAE